MLLPDTLAAICGKNTPGEPRTPASAKGAHTFLSLQQRRDNKARRLAAKAKTPAAVADNKRRKDDLEDDSSGADDDAAESPPTSQSSNDPFTVDLEALQNELERLERNEPQKKQTLPSVSAERIGAADLSLDQLAGLTREKIIIHQRIIKPLSLPTLSARVHYTHANLLLYGPGGTGKTSLARAIAKALNYGFIAPRPSELLSEWESQSERAFASLIVRAKILAAEAYLGLKHTFNGIVLFFDEADSLLGTAGGSSGGGVKSDSGNGSTSAAKIIAEFKNRVQGVFPRLIIIAATNFPDSIRDSGTLRRFQLKLLIGLPSLAESISVVVQDLISQYGNTPNCGEMLASGIRKDVNQLCIALLEEPHASQLRQICAGHTPAEIHEMVNVATGPASVNIDQVRFYQHPGLERNGPSRWIPGEESSKDRKGMRADELDAHLSRPENRAETVCWRLPTPAQFITQMAAAPVKRSTSMAELERFEAYAAKVLLDAEGLARIRESIALLLMVQQSQLSLLR